MVSILENRIDVDADLVEILSKEISQLSRRIDLGESMDESFLLDVNQLQENTMVIRANGVDKQRMLSGILKSDKFPRDVYSKLEVLNKDVDSLIHHANFSFERLEYLQNTALGLINLEQNKLMRVFTFVSLLLMPPTLIASIYGMNVKLPVISENKWWDFVVLLSLMLLSVFMAIFLFRKRKMIK
jgi:magnesium transporter